MKARYKRYFSLIDKWDDKIANNFISLGYAVSIVVPLEKVKVCLLIHQYIENEQGHWPVKTVVFVDMNWYVQYKTRGFEEQFKRVLTIEDLQIKAWELNKQYDNLSTFEATDIQKFIQDNVPDVEMREDFAEYKTLKECLANPNLCNRTQAAELFEKFIYIKDKLFMEAMDNWLKRGNN